MQSGKFPQHLIKYWYQRKFLFSRFNEGIWMNEESWFSVTPEALAKSIAEHISRTAAPSTIIDGFCGAGGNTIQLAMIANRVIAIEKNPVTLRCARHNAQIYGVADKITFIEGDFFEVLARGEVQADVLFMSPPWGGPEYLEQEVFELDQMKPYDLWEIMKAARQVTPNLAMFLPRNSNLDHLRQESDEADEADDQTVLITYLHANNKCKAICVYYGDLAEPASDYYDLIPPLS
ncbi:RNA cap guanine-N2 methyltransferase-domain-containing protein [Limtongia smithiae]|uniref:RNA cap guanine-N2 methyltransferase-domain-containing protein n=1 Tax=Limtongia smithiae TaxID=1125753 RepID=UPI0034CDBB72